MPVRGLQEQNDGYPNFEHLEAEGQRKALAIAVRNNKMEQRFSGLLARLKAGWLGLVTARARSHQRVDARRTIRNSKSRTPVTINAQRLCAARNV
jgi:hypothetical protein